MSRKVRGRLDRPPLLLEAQVRGYLALQAAAQPDQPGGVLREQLLVDSRLVIETFGVSGRNQFDQVVVTRAVGRQQHQMVGGLARFAAAGQAAAVRNVYLASNDRLDAALAGLVVKGNCRKQVAVLRDGGRRHLQALCLVQQLADAAGAVQQRVLRVQMEMDELGVHSHSIVDGGFELMSYTTRFMPCTSLTTREEIVASRSCGRRAQSAVMPSRLSTARNAIVYS